jgi:cob(I)alamin adenosyltransferase
MDQQIKHKKKMQNYKEKVDAKVAAAQEERGLIMVITGNGKGKTTAALGNAVRALGHGFNVGVAQFIKGEWESGEINFMRQHANSNHQFEYHSMNTGFTWDTQDKEADIAAAEKTWNDAKSMLTNSDLKLVVFDEITYMFSFDYLDIHEFMTALQNRPVDQTVIITGRNAKKALIEMADTVSEIKEIKHAYHEGIKAQKGIDW